MTDNTTAAVAGPGALNAKARVALCGVIALYLVLAIFHAFSTPLGFTGYQDAPDEGAHISYIQSISAGLLPSRDHPHWGDGAHLPDYEWHQPPLYYRIAALACGGSPTTDGFGARFVSIFAGLGCIVCAFLIALEIRPGNALVAITAAAIVALTPGHISILSTVNNDSFLELFTSLCLLIVLRVVNRTDGPSRYAGVIVGLTAGLAVMSKATGLLLVPAAAVAIFMMAVGGTNRKALVLFSAQFTALIVLCTGWWFMRNLSLYHELVPLKTFRESFSGTAMAQDVISGKIHLGVSDWQGYWMLVANWAYKSFWAVYGTAASAGIGVPIFLPDTVYLLTLVLCAGGATGMTKLHFKRLTLFTAAQRAGLYVLFTLFALTGLAYARFASEFFQTQGRYLYPAMAPIALILSMGWVAIFPERYRKAGAIGAISVLGLLAVIFALQTSNRGGVHPPRPAAAVKMVYRSGELQIG